MDSVSATSPRGTLGGRSGLHKSSTFKSAKSTIVTEDSKYLGSVHSYHEEEKEGLVDYINGLLHNHYNDHFSINTKSNDIFEQIKDGVLLCKVVNAIQPGVIDEWRINFKDKLSIFEKGENLMLALQTSQDAFGISFVNIGVEDLMEGRPVLVLSVLWQLVNIDLRTRVRFHSREIEYLKQEEPDGAGAEVDISLPQEYKILLRWVNHHLSESGSDRRVNNFTSDFKDSVAYTLLLHQLSPQTCNLDALNEPDLQTRANHVLLSAERVGCKKFISADDILQGNQRLAFAFLAYLFTKFNLPPRLEESKIAEQKLDEQAIVLADIHKERRDVRVALNKTQDKIKEGWVKAAQEKGEAKEEERRLQKRIDALEVTQQLQKEQYVAKVESLKQQLAHAQAAQLPSVPELKKAIAAEEAQQEELIKASEAARLEIKDLKVDVAARTATRAREETQLARVNQEIQTMEVDHAAKTKKLNDRIDAIGITALQQRLDEAVAQTTAATVTNAKLTQTRDTLATQVETEGTARTRASAARRKVEAELERAKRNLEEKRATKVATAAASTKLEKKLVEIKQEITQVKKDVIFVEYQTNTAKDSLEQVTEDTKKVIVEKKQLIVAKSTLVEEGEEIEDQIQELKIKTEEEVSVIKTTNEHILDENRRRNFAEIQQHKEVNEKLTTEFVTVSTHLERHNLAIAQQTTINELHREEIMGFRRDLEASQKVNADLERKNAKLEKKNNFTSALLKEELETNERNDRELRELKEEQQKVLRERDEKLAKREELEKEVYVKELEAKHATELSDDLAYQLRINRPKTTQEELTQKEERMLADEEKRRNNLIDTKKYIHDRKLNKEKESLEKKLTS